MDIGETRREIYIEPMPEDIPVIETVPEPEGVPANA